MKNQLIIPHFATDPNAIYEGADSQSSKEREVQWALCEAGHAEIL